MNNLEFDNLKNETLNFSLRENYRNRSYLNGFNNHVNALFDCESELSICPELLINDNYKFSKVRYYEAETTILEALDDVGEEIEDELSNLEDELYSKIERELGKFYDRNDELGQIIDNTVHTTLLAVKFNFFTNKDNFVNPWDDTRNILVSDNYLFKAIHDSNEFDEIKKLKKGSKGSVELDGSEIYVAVKGKSANLTFGSFKDFVALRKTMLDLIEEKTGSNNRPIKFDELMIEFNRMLGEGNHLNDTEIKSKLIYPLKGASRIGSCKEGYFMLRTCEDIAKSYESHLSRFRGYFKTLEAHRLVAQRTDNSCYDFNKHNR
jgi:hypothetical protein